MLNKILMIADIHIKCSRLHEEYKEVLTNFIEDIKPVCDENTLILCAGDVVDNFTTISNELVVFVSWFFQELDQIGCPVFVIAGNHDLTRGNLSKMDSLSPIFKTNNFQNVRYLDMILGYQSGILEWDENYSFCLYSIFDEYRESDILSYKKDNPNKVIIGLIHAPLIGSRTPLGFTMDKGIRSNIFDGCDIVLSGDIHQPQTILLKNNVKFHYSGSMIMQNFGEKIDGHGYSIISLPDFEIKHVEIENPYKLYKFEINSQNDIENDMEILKNG